MRHSKTQPEVHVLIAQLFVNSNGEVKAIFNFLRNSAIPKFFDPIMKLIKLARPRNRTETPNVFRMTVIRDMANEQSCLPTNKYKRRKTWIEHQTSSLPNSSQVFIFS